MPITTLTIKFTGLFLFVARDHTLNVFMPQTGFTHPPPVDQHFARLQVFKAYIDGHGPVDPKHYSLDALDGCSLTIGPANPSADVGTLSPNLAQTDGFAGGKARSDLFLPHVNGGLSARVVVTGGKQCAETIGGNFRIRGTVEPLCTEVYWALDLGGVQRLQLNIIRLGDGSIVKTRFLSTDQNDICLVVHHVPKGYLPGGGGAHPPPPNPGTIAPHFVALYSLYDNPKDVPIPVYDSARPHSPPAGCPSCQIVGLLGGDPITCVSGGGT